jgi:macrodomain Ter protein organizer (MatP/YcbG family)
MLAARGGLGLGASMDAAVEEAFAHRRGELAVGALQLLHYARVAVGAALHAARADLRGRQRELAGHARGIATRQDRERVQVRDQAHGDGRLERSRRRRHGEATHADEAQDSMLLERAIVDRVPERPEMFQMFASSEVSWSLLAPHVRPTHSFGAITRMPERKARAKTKPNKFAARIAKDGGLSYEVDGKEPRWVPLPQGRPKAGAEVEPSKPRSVRLPDSVWEKLQELAKERGVDVHTLLRALVAAYVGNAA